MVGVLVWLSHSGWRSKLSCLVVRGIQSRVFNMFQLRCASRLHTHVGKQPRVLRLARGCCSAAVSLPTAQGTTAQCIWTHVVGVCCCDGCACKRNMLFAGEGRRGVCNRPAFHTMVVAAADSAGQSAFRLKHAPTKSLHLEWPARLKSFLLSRTLLWPQYLRTGSCNRQKRYIGGKAAIAGGQ